MEVAQRLHIKGASKRYVLQRALLSLIGRVLCKNEAQKVLDSCYSVGLELNFTYGTDSSTLLIIAARSSQNYEIAQWLIEKGADINIRNKNQENAAMIAFGQHAQNIIKLLLQCKQLDPNA